MSVQLDDAYSKIGDYGRGQVLIFFIICTIGQLPASWHIFAIVFLGATPNHWCKPASVDTEWAHVTDQIGNDIAKCGESEEGNSSISCENGWFYSDDLYGWTIVSQWDLVCDRAGFAEISQTVLMVGVMVGAYLAGYLADRFGRKPILFISLFVQGIVGTIQAFSSSFTMFIIVRFFIGVLDQGYELPVYTMVSELFTPRWRPYSFICMMNFWAGGILTLPIIAYFIRDWRYLQLAISIPFLFLPIFYWVIPESPRWLLSNGRYEEATAIVKKIAHFNGKGNVEINFVPEDTGKTEAKESVFQYIERNVVMEEDINGVAQSQSSSTTEKHDHKVIVTSSLRCDSDGVNEVTSTAVICDSEKDAVDTKQVRQRDGQSKATKNSYLELFNGFKMSLVTLVLSILWFVNAFSYYGLSLNAGHIAGDPYLNVFLSGAIEIPSHFLATGIVIWFGRRLPICIFLLVTGMACVGVSFIPEETATGKDLTVAIVTTAMFGKFSIAVAYAIVCLYASEIFPTVVRVTFVNKGDWTTKSITQFIRNKGIGMVTIAARVGALLAPFALLMENSLPQLPMILFGTVAIVPSLLVLLLPEMKGRHQPQTISDLEALFTEDKERRASIKSERGRKLKLTSTTNKAFTAEEEPVV